MNRSKASHYALLAMYEIGQRHREAAHPLGVRAGEIAGRYHLPRAYTAKILSQLAGRGLLVSGRGPRGGFRLSRQLGEISLYDIFDGIGCLAADVSDDAKGSAMPAKLTAKLHEVQEEAAGRVKELFLKTTLADLVENGSNGNF